jgi:hypothetical protein
MTLKITVDHPQLPKGEMISVGGLAVPNGETVEIGPETEQQFIDANEVSIEHYFSGDNAIVSVSGTPEVDWSPPPVEEVEEEAPAENTTATDSVSAALGSEGGET